MDGRVNDAWCATYLSLAPSLVVFLAPEKSRLATAALTSSDPKIAGAMRLRMSLMTSLNGRAANALNSVCSASVKCAFPRAPSLSCASPTTFRYGCEMDTPPPPPRSFAPLPPDGPNEYVPMTFTLVPGVIDCTRLRSTTMRRCRGISPAGTSSGFSCGSLKCVERRQGWSRKAS
eukprot:30837-Pelagococcus_subviridis.AAC.13